jgi:hypothetical protein
MGANDLTHCLSGWHVRETDGRNGVCYRWTGAEAEFRIFVEQGSRALSLMVSGPAILTGEPVPLSLYSGGRRLAHLREAAPTDNWTIAELPLDSSQYGEQVYTLRVETLRGSEPHGHRGVAQLFVPDLYLHNGDFRQLGIMVASIRAL